MTRSLPQWLLSILVIGALVMGFFSVGYGYGAGEEGGTFEQHLSDTNTAAQDLLAIPMADPQPRVYSFTPPPTPQGGDASSSPHGPYTATAWECVLCHRPHRALGPSLISGPFASDICYSCHGPGSDYNIKQAFDTDGWSRHPIRDALSPSSIS